MPGNEDEYKRVLEEIDKLQSIVPSILSSIFEKPDWKSVWEQIKIVSASFKGVKFLSHEEHEQAWERFQNIVNNVKQSQDEESLDQCRDA